MRKFLLIGCIALLGIGTANAQNFSWHGYTDKNDGGNSSITMKESYQNIKGADLTVRSFRGSVTRQYVYGYAGVSILPADDTTAQELKTAKGIIVSIKGDGRQYRLSVVTSSVTDYNDFGMLLRANTHKANEVKVLFSQPPLSQDPSWGRHNLVFDKSTITGLKIQTIGQPIAQFNFTILDIRFIK